MKITNGLFDKLFRLQCLLQKQHHREHASRGPMANTQRGQGRILTVLKMKDGMSTKELSYLLGIRISSLNELLGKLEKGGYLTREPAEADKRVMLLRLTEKGQQAEPAEQDFSGAFHCLTEEEQATLGGYLDRMIAGLEAQLGDEPPYEGMGGRNWEEMRAALHSGEFPFRDMRDFRDFRDWSRPRHPGPRGDKRHDHPGHHEHHGHPAHCGEGCAHPGSREFGRLPGEENGDDFAPDGDERAPHHHHGEGLRHPGCGRQGRGGYDPHGGFGPWARRGDFGDRRGYAPRDDESPWDSRNGGYAPDGDGKENPPQDQGE